MDPMYICTCTCITVVHFALACVASASVGFRSKELPCEKKRGEVEGKEGNACRQTPGF